MCLNQLTFLLQLQIENDEEIPFIIAMKYHICMNKICKKCTRIIKIKHFIEKHKILAVMEICVVFLDENNKYRKNVASPN